MMFTIIAAITEVELEIKVYRMSNKGTKSMNTKSTRNKSTQRAQKSIKTHYNNN